MNQRVLFLHPHIPARFNGVPMGMLYLAAVAEQNGHECLLIDLQAEPGTSKLFSCISSFEPTVVAISSTSPSHRPALDLAAAIKALRPDIPIIKGGVHDQYCADTTLSRNSQIDYCMIGECDHSFSDFLNTLPDKDALSSVAGLLYRRDGAIRRNPKKLGKVHLDSLPYPKRDLLGDPKSYDFRIFNGKRTTQVQTMRGCPFHCSFCNQSIGNPSVRSPESVVEELKHIRMNGYQAVFFDDATFTSYPSRLENMLSIIRSNSLELDLACQTRAELITETLASLMASAGFSYISFGLETTDEDALKSMMKTKSPTGHLNRSVRAAKFCKDAGIRTCFNLIVGLPGETNEKLQKTFEFVNRAAPDFVSISVLAKYPHEDSALADQYEKGMSQEEIWRDFDEGYGAIHPYMTADRAAEVLSMASRMLGDKLALV